MLINHSLKCDLFISIQTDQGPQIFPRTQFNISINTLQFEMPSKSVLFIRFTHLK